MKPTYQKINDFRETLGEIVASPKPKKKTLEFSLKDLASPKRISVSGGTGKAGNFSFYSNLALE
jgi:hypothetical protein